MDKSPINTKSLKSATWSFGFVRHRLVRPVQGSRLRVARYMGKEMVKQVSYRRPVVGRKTVERRVRCSLKYGSATSRTLGIFGLSPTETLPIRVSDPRLVIWCLRGSEVILTIRLKRWWLSFWLTSSLWTSFVQSVPVPIAKLTGFC